jgi:hypothetical protein
MSSLFVNSLLFLLVIIILAGVFKNYSIIKDIFVTKPLLSKKY